MYKLTTKILKLMFNRILESFDTQIFISIGDLKSMSYDRNKPLIELSLEEMKKYGTLSHDLSLIQGPSKHAIDFLIIIEELFVGVWVLDWKRSVGTDKIIHIERLVQRSNLSGGFIIANNFSPNARDLAGQTDTLELIERAEILYHT